MLGLGPCKSTFIIYYCWPGNRKVGESPAISIKGIMPA